MANAKVYRIGEPVVGNHSEKLLKYWNPIDSQRPEGHPARANSVYAGINAHAMNRWMEAAIFMRRDVIPHELTINPDTTFVYNIEAYERCCHSSGVLNEFVPAYWATGVTLTEWLATHSPEEAPEWELMIPEEEIIKARHLSFRSVQTVMKNAEIELGLGPWEKRLFVPPAPRMQMAA